LTGVTGACCLPGAAQAAGRQIPVAATVQATLVPPTAPAAPAIAAQIPLRVRNPAAYARAKRAAHPVGPAIAGSSTTSSGPLTPTPNTAVFGGLNASGLSAAQEIAAFGSSDDLTPPDTTGAIGPSQYIAIVNSELAMYSRTDLSMVGSPVALTTFTGGTSPCDPQIKFDPQSARWFYVALRCDGTTNTNQLYVGWSKTTNPPDLTTASWCTFKLLSAPKTSLDDYPKLGLDASHLIIGSNLFNASSGAFETAHILLAPKPSAGTITSCGSTPTFTVFGSTASPLMTRAGNGAFTPEPATVADGSSSNGYVVASDLDDPTGDVSGSGLMVWQVGGSASSPTLAADGDIAVSSFVVPPPVPQPAPSIDTLDSMDGRLTQAVAAADPNAGGAEAVWTQHTIDGGTGGSVVRWYEIVPSTMTVRQSGTVSDAAGFAFNGAIAPTLTGGAVIDYNTGGVTQTVEVKAQSRGPSATLGEMFTPITLASSSAVDSDFSCPSHGGTTFGDTSCRWGDYAGASVDPSNPNLVWGSNQVNGPLPAVSGDAQWATQTFALRPNLPPTASFTAAPNPATIGALVGFNAGASTDPEGTISSYSWSFGDGSTGTGVAPAHSYATAGNYTVTLTVTSDSGQTANASQIVTVLHRPTASFTVSPSPAVTGSAVRFDAGSSTAPDTTITGYRWSFGDGRTGTGALATHRYATRRTYTVTLTVTDNLGQTATASRNLAVRPALHGRLRIPKHQTLPAVLQHGLVVSLSATERTRARFRITTRIKPKPHRRATVLTLLRARPRVVRGGAHRITLKLSAAGVRRLQGDRTVVITVRVTLTDVYGQKLTLSARAKLRR
jgi:PKD repeat protein